MAYTSRDLLNEFGRLMHTFQKRGFSAVSKKSREFWANQPKRGQMRLIYLLSQKDELTNSQIVDELDIRPSSVSVMIKKLEEDGLVERHDSPDDKRISLISLSDKGRDLIKSSHDFKTEFSDSLFDGLNDDEKEEFGRLLAKLTDSLDEKFSKWDDGEERPDFFDKAPEQFFNGRGGFHGFNGHHQGHGNRNGFGWGGRNGFDRHDGRGFDPRNGNGFDPSDGNWGNGHGFDPDDDTESEK